MIEKEESDISKKVNLYDEKLQKKRQLKELPD